jgi:hypothetical protein
LVSWEVPDARFFPDVFAALKVVFDQQVSFLQVTMMVL